MGQEEKKSSGGIDSSQTHMKFLNFYLIDTLIFKHNTSHARGKVTQYTLIITFLCLASHRTLEV